jgi:hypothetical protein
MELAAACQARLDTWLCAMSDCDWPNMATLLQFAGMPALPPDIYCSKSKFLSSVGAGRELRLRRVRPRFQPIEPDTRKRFKDRNLSISSEYIDRFGVKDAARMIVEHDFHGRIRLRQFKPSVKGITGSRCSPQFPAGSSPPLPHSRRYGGRRRVFRARRRASCGGTQTSYSA